MSKISINNICIHVILSLLTGIISVFLLSEIGFILGLSINIFYLLLSIIAMVYGPKVFYKFTLKEQIYSFGITIGIIILSAFVTMQYRDISWDGLWYHETGILFLKKGWNPIYQTAQDFLQTHWYAQKVSGLTYIESYPKFCEIFAANIYYLTENIETGKIINLLSLSILGLYSFYVLIQTVFKQKYFLAFVTSIAFCANPIVIQQLYTCYVDGNIYIYFMLIIFSLLDIEKTPANQHNFAAWYIFIASAVIIANIKLGGFIYFIEIALLYSLYLFIYKKKPTLSKFKKILIIILLGIFLTGINPYLTNLKQGKHILHPIAGMQKEDLMTHNMPIQFINKSMPYKLFISTFSYVDNILSQVSLRQIQLKLPFTYHQIELNKFLWDTRQCGFGIFWSGILLITLVLSFFVRPKKNLKIKLYTLTAFLCLITALTNPENWWARYVPQFHAVPILIGIAFLCTKQNFVRSKIYNLFIILILFNFSIVFNVIINRTKQEHQNLEFYLQQTERAMNYQQTIKDIEANEIPQNITAPILILLDKYNRK